MSTTSQTGYRPDIDGLRAVAVASVLVFHAFPTKLPGGFVGVDVFFVISGFLISRLIYQSLQQGRFSYTQFYTRRIRRIFPALLVVLAATLAIGAWLLLPREYGDLGRQAVAGVGFFANILFWSDNGYFNAAQQLKPLLHLWSLGIEEQFYITWPLILAFLYPRTRWLPWIICGLVLISFGWNVTSIGRNPTGTFYLPMSRYWELLIGATLAYPAVFSNPAVTRPDGAGRFWRVAGIESLALVGILLIGASLLFINEGMPFPGWWALPPTAGACCIIGAGNAWINRRLLGNRVLVFIGLISYPLYLWHWVLICALQHKLVWAASRSERIGVILLSVLLAWLTYVFIEKPIRFGGRAPTRVMGLVAFAVVIGLVGVLIDLSGGVPSRYPKEIRSLATFSYDAHRDYREDVCQLDKEQPFSDLGAQCIDPSTANSRLLVLWGDSHASSLYQGLKAIQANTPGLRLAQLAASGCPPLLGVRLGARRSCLEFNEDAFARIGQLQPAIVVLEGFWDAYADSPNSEEAEMAALRATVVRLAQAGVPRVVVVGDLPRWVIWQSDAAVELWRELGRLPERTFTYFIPNSARIDTLVGQAISGTSAVFISPINSLCNTNGCLLLADNERNTPVAWDNAHLTDAGSRLLVGLNVAKILGSEPLIAAAR